MATVQTKDYVRLAMDLIIHLPDNRLPKVVHYLESISGEAYDAINVGEDIKHGLKEVQVAKRSNKKLKSAQELINDL